MFMTGEWACNGSIFFDIPNSHKGWPHLAARVATANSAAQAERSLGAPVDSNLWVGNGRPGF